MSIWFALGYDGNLYNLCDCGDIEAAEESAADVIPDMEGQVTASKALWLFDEHTAHEWVNVLMKGISMNSKLKLSAVEVPSGSEESENDDNQLYVRINGHLDVLVRRIEENYIFSAFEVGGIHPLVTTRVHDNDLLEEEEETNGQ